RVVIPGDQLRFECTFLREKLGMIKMHCDATVDGQLAACADMMCSYRSPK
ncbi:MAG TPA: 3-hydroxyacyl-[acyl-carrier-protein] dehydratase FabZ, partial [Sutterellaceae bacterium]|nr:3-hydroxyacyl-[acyl-carrier-protein] dehydratase FabZ [Sutterellaceae bacterium]